MFFWNLKKNVKYVFSNAGLKIASDGADVTWVGRSFILQRCRKLLTCDYPLYRDGRVASVGDQNKSSSWRQTSRAAAFYSATVRVRSIVINPSVCASVCPWAYLWNRWTDRHDCRADPLLPWLGPPLAALRYVMYFRFMDDVAFGCNGLYGVVWLA